MLNTLSSALPATWLPWLLGATLALAAILFKPKWLRTLLAHAEHGSRQIASFCQRSAERILAIRPAITPSAQPYSMHGMDASAGEAHAGDEAASGPANKTTGETDAAIEAAWTPWVGFNLFAKLIYGVFSALLLSSAYSLDTGRSCVVQFANNGDCSVPTLINVSVANGLLWFVCIAYFGGLLAEGIGWVEEHLHLFPHLTPPARRSLTIFAGVGVALSMVAVTLLYTLGQLKLQHIDFPAMVLLISAIQGALVNGAGIPAVASLIVGLGAAIGLVCVVGWLVFTTLHRLLQLLGQLVTRKEPVLTAAGPYYTGEENLMILSDDTAKALYLVGVGRDPAAFVQRQALPAVHRFGGKAALGGWATFDPTRAHRAPISPAGGDDFSPLRADVQAATGLRGSSVEQMRLVIHKLMKNIADQAMAVGQAKGQILVSLDVESIPLASPALIETARTLSGHTIALLLHLSAPGVSDPDVVVSGLAELTRLKRMGVITSVIPLDARSPFVLHSGAGGESAQERYAAFALGQTVAAHVQDEGQPTLGEVLRQIGRSYPFCGLATQSASIPASKAVVWWKRIWRLFHRGQRGYSDVAIISNLALHTVGQLLQDTAHACIDAPADPQSAPLYVIVTSPLRLRDTARWSDLRDDIERGLTQMLPSATALFVHGNGVQNEKLRDQYYLQVSLWYGVRALPQERQVAPEDGREQEERDETADLLEFPAPLAPAEPALPTDRRAGRARRLIDAGDSFTSWT
jgi:hypothetical protein